MVRIGKGGYLNVPYDTVVVGCHHILCFCGDRTKMSFHEKNVFIFRETPTLPGSHLWRNLGP